MAIRREHRPSDLEKRLKILNQQLYGKESVNKITLDTHDTPKHLDTHRSDILYLRRDLTKITLLATLAFGAQIALYFALTNNLLKLPF